ncbi:nucleotidyl transferase AbiEii/AbiGii toxin family protein [Kineococcus sp. SYSU DK001]|uniref:nucleotidyl transferase AbiEii/AbiGii toxin family protein n=1 Tax=Kineococcus sp. SYSU DK001 TaxID=3383122 RepID=UPI003D7D3D6A
MNTRQPPADPGSLSVLQRRITTAARTRAQTTSRLQVTVAQVVVAQLLPGGAVKGGAGLKLRLGDAFTRDSRDLDTAVREDVDTFVADLTDRLRTGWGGFTGEVSAGVPPAPAGVPAGYVMRPFTIKLRYHGKPFLSLPLEIGYDELDALGGSLEDHLAEDVTTLFSELGLPAPQPVRLLPTALQIAQKIHACTAPGSQRAHDLVDLQLLAPGTDDTDVAVAVRRLFAFRRAHPLPATLTPGPDWDSRYTDAATGLDVHPALEEAVAWADEYLRRLARQPT